MGYNIYIGEEEMKHYPEDGIDELGVKEIILDNAPEFGFVDISGKSNGRFPGYSQMSKFCKTTGLYELFYDEDNGLLHPHPGCRPITQEHLDTVVGARKNWEEIHPNCKELLPTKDKEPDYTRSDLTFEDRTGSQYDWVYARLVWYEFWFEWALKNCKKPSISNG